MKKILIAMMCAAALVFMAGCTEAALEEAAVPVVNQIVEENLGPIVGKENLAKCTKVDLEEKVSDNKWTGKAYFDNGKEIDCTVTDLGEQIQVEIDFASIK